LIIGIFGSIVTGTTTEGQARALHGGWAYFKRIHTSNAMLCAHQRPYLSTEH